MKKIFIPLILFIFLLSGCGIYNLGNFTLSNDVEFLTLIQKLDTPRKICQYMNDNFIYKKHLYYTPDPYVLWKTKKGDCNDMATFAQFIAEYHGYKTYLVRIKYSNFWNDHCIAIYNFNGCLHFSDNQYYVSTGYSNFRDIVKIDTLLYQPIYIWSSYIVYDYNNNIIEKGIK